jgi:PAS domain S-box-containing protein
LSKDPTAARFLLFRSIRAKLLVMLVLLSLPLLVISLFQLQTYRSSLSDRAATITQIETTAAAAALSTWLGAHPDPGYYPGRLSSADASDIYQRLAQHTYSVPEIATAVFDSEGRAIVNPEKPGPFPSSISPNTAVSLRPWSDGTSRITGVRTIEPFGWAIAVGGPRDERTAGRSSALVLTVAWAFGMVASVLLGVWAVGRFTKPLRELTASASTLGSGNLSTRATIETEDEVGELASTFNAMASQLQNKFNEVHAQGVFIEEVLDGLPIGIAVVDSRLIIKRANPTFAAFVGRSVDKIAGRGLYEAAAGLAVLSDVVEDVRRSRKPFVSYSLPLTLVSQRHKENDDDQGGYFDATIWPITEQGGTRGNLIVVLSEVSKRVRAEKLATSAFSAERTRAAELAGVINQMNEGVVIIDQNARYKVNIAGMNILGRTRTDFRDGAGALIEDLGLRDLNGDPVSAQNSPLWRALVSQESISNEHFQVQRLGGEQRVVAVSAAPLKSEAGEPEGAVAVFRDITEEVQGHKQLVAAYDRLKEHDRLKSAFVSNVTHELRTPLNVILGLCQLLSRDKRAPLAALQEDAVSRMERNARSLLELVNDLIDYSRLEAGRSALRLEWVDVSDLVEKLINDYKAVATEKGIILEYEVADSMPLVLTDAHKLQQVLTNLVGNAVKFTSAGSVNIKVSTVGDDSWVIEVSDTGIGISTDAIQFIFDEFRQVDDRLTRSYGGTGLGLAITRRISELLEGEIEVESTPGVGSCFRIKLPRVVRQRTGTGSLSEVKVLQIADAKGLRSIAS